MTNKTHENIPWFSAFFTNTISWCCAHIIAGCGFLEPILTHLFKINPFYLWITRVICLLLCLTSTLHYVKAACSRNVKLFAKR